MNRITLPFCIAIIFLFLLSACVRNSEDQNNIYIGERISMNMRLSSTVALDDSHIEKARVIIFNQAGKLVFNNIVAIEPITGGVSLKIEVARGINNFYVVCNETVDLTTKLAAVTHESEIDAITFNPAGTAIPIPMYGSVKGALISSKKDGTDVKVEINGNITNDLTIGVKRLVAKIDITVIKNIVDTNADFVVEELVVKVCRMPKFTPLKEGVPYESDVWADNLEISKVVKLDNNGAYSVSADGKTYTVPTDVDNIKFSDIYIPEHLFLDVEKAEESTYLLIDSKYKMKSGNTQSMHSLYIVNIGENPPVNHNLTRNNHYKIYLTIKGLGAMGIYAEIVPFAEYYHPVEWKPFEGYTIVSERAAEYGNNVNISNDYSQFHGVLKVITNKVVLPAQFRYGSIFALNEGSVEADFNATTDVLWSSTSAVPASWNDVSYLSSGDIKHTVESLAQGKGDPCRLVGLTLDEIRGGTIDNLLWRMPKASEMEWLITARNDVADPRGFYSFHSMITPKTGYRDNAGYMVPSASNGYYWSSEAAKSLIFNTIDNSKVSLDTDDPAKAYSVRCIRQTIHPSRFNMNGANLNWTGSTNIRLSINNSYLTPFWKLIPEEPTPSSIQYSVTQGGEADLAAVCAVDQLIYPYQQRMFKSKAYGYGLDGVVHTIDVTIIQIGLIHTIKYELISPTDLPIKNGSMRIPAEGVTLRYKMSVSPELFEPYLSVKDQLQWRIKAYWYNDRINNLDGVPAFISGISDIEIPPNKWDHAVAVDVSFGWAYSPLSTNIFPPSVPIVIKNTFIQEKEVK